MAEPKKPREPREADTRFETEFFENVLRRAPDFVQALSALGDLYTRQGLYTQGLEIDLRLVCLRPGDPVVLYNLACSHSLLQDMAKARAAMEQALQLGFDDVDHLIKDPDLAGLLADRDFQKFLQQYTAGHGGRSASGKDQA